MKRVTAPEGLLNHNETLSVPDRLSVMRAVTVMVALELLTSTCAGERLKLTSCGASVSSPGVGVGLGVGVGEGAGVGVGVGLGVAVGEGVGVGVGVGEGIAAASAACALTTPPVATFPVRAEDGVAVSKSFCRTCKCESCGFCDIIRAATPETMGAAKDVPSM